MRQGTAAAIGLVLFGCGEVPEFLQPVDAPPRAGAGGTAGEPDPSGSGGAGGTSASGGGVSGDGASGGAVGGGTTSGAAEPIPATLAVDVNQRFQTLEGFGASVAWYGDWLTESPNEAEIYDVVFRDLGLDILRLRNIYRDDPVDFDPIAAEIVKEATRSLGRKPTILMTSWTPPARLKANLDTECVGEDTCTLAKVDGAFVYSEFADYWRDAIVAYAGLGIAIDLVGIQNEPDFIPPSWEGCRFDANEGTYPSYATALTEVRSRLTESNLNVRLLGPEVVGPGGGKIASYTADLDPAAIDVVAHHLYDGETWRTPNRYIASMQQAARVMPDKPLFQTEFSVPGGDGAFEIAWLIHNSLVEQGAAAYLHWDLVWRDADGLVSLEDPSQQDEWQTPRGYRIRDAYYSVQHFARFTDPGDVRVAVESPATDLEASGFLSPDGRRLTVTLLNTGTDVYEVQWSAPGFASGSVVLYRTSASERFASLGALEVGEALRMPSRSIATLVFSAP